VTKLTRAEVLFAVIAIGSTVSAAYTVSGSWRASDLQIRVENLERGRKTYDEATANLKAERLAYARKALSLNLFTSQAMQVLQPDKADKWRKIEADTEKELNEDAHATPRSDH